MFDTVERYPGLKGVMGNNELTILQLPRTFYFFESAWRLASKARAEPDVLQDLAERLLPGPRGARRACLRAPPRRGSGGDPCRHRSPRGIDRAKDTGRPGSIGRFLFPDQLTLLRVLKAQLEIRAARQSLIHGLQGTPAVEDSAALLEALLRRAARLEPRDRVGRDDRHHDLAHADLRGRPGPDRGDDAPAQGHRPGEALCLLRADRPVLHPDRRPPAARGTARTP